MLPPDFAAKHGGNAKWTSLRPERIGVYAPSALVPAVHASAEGIITAISYQGATKRITVNAGDQRLVAAVPAGSAHFKQGDNVRLMWSKSAMIAMEDGA
jgi:putative spermidine/putrescine transport system ATP-binding protein